MKTGNKIIAILLFFALMAGCQSRQSADSPPSSSYAQDSEAVSEAGQIDADEIMNRYIIPYEYFCGGQNWDYSDPYYTWPYDPEDIFSRQITIDYPVEAFALSIVVRELPEPARKSYVNDESDRGVNYNVTGQLWDAVSRFYFGAPAPDPRDCLHSEDHFEGGIPRPVRENEGFAVSLGEIETLADGDVRVTVERALSGRPILSCVYVLRPFTVEDVPAELAGIYAPGDRAFRFISVEDIPFEAVEKTIEIKTADDLRELSRIVNSGDPSYAKTTYLLTNDIDMAGESLDPIGQFMTYNDHDPACNGFNAVFDGQGYAIRNLGIHRTMTDPEQIYNTGLFALIGRYGQVKNLNLEDCDISFVTGSETSLCGNATGGLAGMSYGSVVNCSVSGKITGNYQVGGLIGASGWSSAADSCSANVSVTGESEIGAFIGALNNALITNCSAAGEVTAVNLPGGYDRPRAIGGFSGFMVMGTVRDCKASAYVKTEASSDWVGGFMGYNQGEILSCLYDGGKAGSWEPVDVIYQDAVSDVKDISEREPVNSPPSQEAPETGITMRTAKTAYPLDADFVEVVITNGTSEESGYGLGYRVEYNNSGSWEEIPLNFAVMEIYAILMPGDSNTQSISLWHEQHEYIPGEYRIVMRIGADEYSAGFELI